MKNRLKFWKDDFDDDTGCDILAILMLLYWIVMCLVFSGIIFLVRYLFLIDVN